jgi:hypothetical protein
MEQHGDSLVPKHAFDELGAPWLRWSTRIHQGGLHAGRYPASTSGINESM